MRGWEGGGREGVHLAGCEAFLVRATSQARPPPSLLELRCHVYRVVCRIGLSQCCGCHSSTPRGQAAEGRGFEVRANRYLLRDHREEIGGSTDGAQPVSGTMDNETLLSLCMVVAPAEPDDLRVACISRDSW